MAALSGYTTTLDENVAQALVPAASRLIGTSGHRREKATAPATLNSAGTLDSPNAQPVAPRLIARHDPAYSAIHTINWAPLPPST
ncbi:hypothetical protein SBA4_6620003 [Candidatus Sulfopaludibacter sp. SbA4]|nr:hypothetical protein SBA4_6620003 [Candidatus Sulfopaludibacter sp. SbA4]